MEVKKENNGKRGRPRKEYSIRERRDIICGGCKGCPHQIYYSVRFYHEGKRIERSIPDLSEKSIKAVLDQYQNIGERKSDESTFPQKSSEDNNSGERNWVNEFFPQKDESENIGERQPWSETYYLDIPEVNLVPRNDVPLQHPDGKLTWKNGEFILEETG